MRYIIIIFCCLGCNLKEKSDANGDCKVIFKNKAEIMIAICKYENNYFEMYIHNIDNAPQDSVLVYYNWGVNYLLKNKITHCYIVSRSKNQEANDQLYLKSIKNSKMMNKINVTDQGDGFSVTTK